MRILCFKVVIVYNNFREWEEKIRVDNVELSSLNSRGEEHDSQEGRNWAWGWGLRISNGSAQA
mgnify:CR=1 FL=1